MSANINTYVQASDTAAPWWSDGNHQTLSASASIEDWMRVSKLDYTVGLRKLYMRLNREDSAATREIPYHAVVNNQTGQVYHITRT